MLRATLKSLLARKVRLVLSAMSIVLGVSFVSGAFVLTDSLGKTFDDLFSTLNKNVAVDVRGTPVLESSLADGTTGSRHPLPVSLLETVRGVEGVAEAQPGIAGIAQLVDSQGKAVSTGGAPTLGFNWYDSTRLSAATVVDGRGPTADDEIVINRSLAEEAGYTVGDSAPVLTEGPTRTYRIVGIVAFEDGQGSLAGSTNVFFTQATAHEVLAREGVYDEILVAAEDGVSQEQLRDRVAEVLPGRTEALTGEAYAEEQSSDVKDALGFFSTFLLVFAVIALFVGAFIIFNTFSMLVAQRTRELALLRALGASRGQVTRSVLLEAVVVGALSSLIGLAVGVGVAALLRWAFGAIGAELPDGPTVIATRTVVAAFAVGILVTAVAALLPARRASKVPPLAALRDAATPDRSLTRQTVAGAVLLGAGVVALAFALNGAALWILGLGTFLAFIGVALLSPLVSRPIAGAVGGLFARALPGRLGRQNSLRNPRRTASTAAALMVGLALVSAVSVLGASLKASVEKIIDGAIGADFVLSGEGPGFPDDVMTRVAAAPGVASVAGVKMDAVQVDGSAQYVTALDPQTFGSSVTLVQNTGSVDTVTPQTVLLSHGKSQDLGIGAGDSVTVQFAKGAPRAFSVAGTYDDNELVGDFVFDASVASSFLSQRNVAALVQLSDGADAAAARSAIDAQLTSYPNVDVQDRSEFVDETASQIDVIVSIISILLLLSVIIAVLGVVNTLALSVIERTRELGLLRAVGMSRRQVKRMIRVESVIISVFGGVLGLVVGAAFGVALQQALEDEGVTELRFPLLRLVIFLLLAAVAGVAAAWLPARRASRLNVLGAIATE
jgi:putative ABC transport system permease protein